MPKGIPWTEEENKLVTEMYSEGASLREIATKLGRSVGAIKQKIRRLNLHREVVVVTPKISLPQVEDATTISQEEALKILAGAIKTLQKGGEIDGLELDRLRTIITAVRTYFSVYEKVGERTEEEDVATLIEKLPKKYRKFVLRGIWHEKA